MEPFGSNTKMDWGICLLSKGAVPSKMVVSIFVHLVDDLLSLLFRMFVVYLFAT